MSDSKTTRAVTVGGRGKTKRITLGGGAPVVIQTMWKEGIAHLADDDAGRARLVERIAALEHIGCGVLRFAVPDKESARSLAAIAADCTMPLVADIHFDYRLALACLAGPVAAIRINPGNIGRVENVKAVVAACRDAGAAIRIGVNSGSLPRDIAAAVRDGTMSRAAALAAAAAREAAILDALNFSAVVVSMKSSSVQETIAANELFAQQSDIPLHIGVTEAGPLIGGVVKSTIALTALLRKDIGATVRVSLSSAPEHEVIAAREILRETGKRTGGVTIVSCPRCGREGFDVHAFVARWQQELLALEKDITVAVMGCAVNGPGEGRHADVGITGAGGKAIIFKRGEIVQTVDEKDADKVFRDVLYSL
ncbi:MAG: (E)-4-hydroxy-3-methylbut-2-enyl-diphosphate synthase [Treponema sp.]|nr:(E)-4-hydroxy-3-methylbut-2-enyl-diphosphate synthase [Treponema sp.]